MIAILAKKSCFFCDLPSGEILLQIYYSARGHLNCGLTKRLFGRIAVDYNV
jgi:hypothetical protein